MRFLATLSMTADVTKAFLKKAVEELATNPYPDYIKRDYFSRIDEEGLIFYVLYDIETGHLEEGVKDIHNRMLKFAGAIEGDWSSTGLLPLVSIEELYASLIIEPPAEFKTDS